MVKLTLERFLPRGVARFLSDELDLSGLKMTVDTLLQMMGLGALGIFILVTFLVDLVLKVGLIISLAGGLAAGAVFVVLIYAMLEYRIEGRKNFVESVLPDYVQLTAANMRSGIALDKALVASARPEFGFFSQDIFLLDKQIYSGETIQNALTRLGTRYRSRQLQHILRMMNESIRYGGSMNDLLRQLAKDLRNQQIIQKEITGQLFLYTIFISFAVLIGAPALYALTNKMITVTDTVWQGILKSNPNGLPSTGVGFLHPSPPKITSQQYFDFSLTAVLLISAMGSFIVSVISNGSVLKGLRILPLFIIVGVIVFYVVGIVMNGIFSSVTQ